MKSGLKDRNNKPALAKYHRLERDVSMKSGLKDRNNGPGRAGAEADPESQ